MSNYDDSRRIQAQMADERGIVTYDDLSVVGVALAPVAPDWLVVLNQASFDEATIVIRPPGETDLLGPAFALYRTPFGVHLDQLHWGEYRELGVFASLARALAVLREHLSPLTAEETPRSIVRH